MAQRNSGKRTGNRTANRRQVVDDDDDEEDDDGQMSDAELLAQVRAAAGRNNGNAEMAALGYLRDIRKLRRQRNAARDRIRELEDEMPEGSIVLVGEEAAAIRDILETRKLDPKKLKDLLGKLESDLATERKTNLDNADELLYSRIAEITGYDRDAVKTVVRSGNQHAELREIEVDGTGADRGKKIKIQWPHVRPKGDDKAALTKFDDFVDKEQKFMWESLKRGKSTPKSQSTGSNTAIVDNTSAPKGGNDSGDDLVKASLGRDKKRSEGRPDPFRIMKSPMTVGPVAGAK